jgi:hypothetical protein
MVWGNQGRTRRYTRLATRVTLVRASAPRPREPAAFLSNARGILVRMPARWVRTAIARWRPHSHRRSSADSPALPTVCPSPGDSPPTSPRHVDARLSPSFCLECIASQRPSNGLPGRSHRAPPSLPLDTELDAPSRHEQPNAEGGPTEAWLLTISRGPFGGGPPGAFWWCPDESEISSTLRSTNPGTGT